MKITLPGQREQVLIEFGPGAFFGEVALLDQSVRTAQARAIEDTQIVALFRAEFYSLLETHSAIASRISFQLARVLAARLRQAILNTEPASRGGLAPDAMNRALASGPIVWLGIIVTTCLLLVLFQTVLWLVLPVLLAVVAYYILSPLVNIGHGAGPDPRPRRLIVTVLFDCRLCSRRLDRRAQDLRRRPRSAATRSRTISRRRRAWSQMRSKTLSEIFPLPASAATRPKRDTSAADQIRHRRSNADAARRPDDDIE